VAIVRNAVTLARWAQFSPSTRMPDSLDGMQVTEQIALLEADPELHSLLAGNAPAELELAALNGSLSAAPTTPQERADAVKAARVAELLATQPAGRPGYYREVPNGEPEYVPPQPGNVTALMELQALDLEAAQREQLQAIPPRQTGLSEQDAAWVNAEAQRIASLNMTQVRI